jgi:hypothetical protein
LIFINYTVKKKCFKREAKNRIPSKRKTAFNLTQIWLCFSICKEKETMQILREKAFQISQ